MSRDAVPHRGAGKASYRTASERPIANSRVRQIIDDDVPRWDTSAGTFVCHRSDVRFRVIAARRRSMGLGDPMLGGNDTATFTNRELLDAQRRFEPVPLPPPDEED